jgi:hypothetical protein
MSLGIMIFEGEDAVRVLNPKISLTEWQKIPMSG